MKSVISIEPIMSKARRGSSQTSKRRFSLVELLIVIAIFAILASLLSPSLRKISRRVDTLECASNLHGIGNAMGAYLMDHDDFYPRANNNNNESGRAWDDEMSDYDGRNLTEAQKNGGVAPDGGHELYACPTDEYERNNDANPRSYALNHFGWAGEKALSHSEARPRDAAGTAIGAVGQYGDDAETANALEIEMPSSFIIITETNTNWYSILGRWSGTHISTPWGQFNEEYPLHENIDFRSSQFNYLFADFHVSSLFVLETIGEGNWNSGAEGMWTKQANDD
jgi:prepilin-type N-terminal cleavage/methylation domain-containing protein/prepilin-type processing-associated H-X9-DG protein